MTDYQKIIDIMFWETFEGETPEQVYAREARNAVPPFDTLVDVVHAGGLQKWAEQQEDVKSEKELNDRLVQVMRRTIADPIFNDKRSLNNFPPFTNFFYNVQRLDRYGKLANEATAIADMAWNSVICRERNKKNIEQLFSQKPDAERYRKISKRIAEIWGFSEKQIDALRYFVCQTRHENHNPSLNKSIYIWGKLKGTGKTTVGRAIITILNGDVWENWGTYESTLNKEMGYNDHDLPLAALYKCVFLDETVPKDSRKSYGGVKKMLTSNSYSYNPKFRQVMTIPCNRLYIFTSNNDIVEFIQDENERRFVAVEITKKPEQISFEEIYDIWKEFAINCEPEEDWKDWYDSFELVNGLESMYIEELKNEMILRKDELFSTSSGQGTYFSIKSIANILFKNEPTPDQRNTVKSAIYELFSRCRTKSNPSLYSKSMAREIITKIEERSENSGSSENGENENENDIDSDIDDGLPF